MPNGNRDAMRRVSTYEAVQANDPSELAILLNLANDAIEWRGGMVINTYLPDIVSWQALDQRHPLYAMIEYLLPDRGLATAPSPAHPGATFLQVVPPLPRAGNGE